MQHRNTHILYIMKKFISLLFFLLVTTLSTTGWAAERQLAFPGAEGYGRYVTGGRGGEVCYVTRLDDCSDSQLVEGTLRWAIRHDNGGKPRTILFATAGTIYLTSKLKFQYPDVSILGQSAPGGGITITGYNMYICKNNVIVRYLRFRAGDIPNTSMTGLDIENADRVILDHCSMTWSMEECLTAYDTDSTTIQWCIIGEGLYNSKNAKGARAYAMQWGGEHSTMHHTLITNSHSRAPRFNGVRSSSSKKGDHDYQVDSEFANNVIFNGGQAYGGEYDKSKVEVNAWNASDPGYNRVYMINNYFRPGPCTIGCNNNKFVGPSSPYGEWYLDGNKFDLNTEWTSAKSELEAKNKDNYRNLGISDAYKLTSIPYALSGLSYESADSAFAHVTTQAGATLPRIDEVDQRLQKEAAGIVAPKFHGPTLPSQLGIIDSPDNITLSYPDSYIVGGETYNNMPRMLFADDKFAIDSDADGMPDGYETEKGFDPKNPADGAAIASNGYSNLENYLNGIVDGTVNKTNYETSTFMVEPGMSEIPENVTITFTKGNVTFEGTVPESKTLPYGDLFTIPYNYAVYKEGYTLKGWLCNGLLYETGTSYHVTRDLTLTPMFELNKVQLSQRQEDVIIKWDFSTATSPATVKGEGVNGIYVTQVLFSGASHDVVLRYDNNVFTVPACKNGSIQLNENEPVLIEDEVSEYQLTGPAKRSALKSVTVKMPYNWNTPGRIYYTPQPDAGALCELIYTTPEVASQSDWIGGSYYEYTQVRTFYDPVKDDGQTYALLDQSLVFNASDRTLDMFITGTIKLVAYITNQSSNENSALIIATPSDGSESVQVKGKVLATKQTPEILELSGLDKNKCYRVRLVANADYDIAIGAVKLYTTDQAEVTEGDASIEWVWAGTKSDAVQTPKGIFPTNSVTFSDLTEMGQVKDKNTTVKYYYGVRPTVADGAKITFNFATASSVQFQPAKVSFAATRNGTGLGKYTVTLKQGNVTKTLATEVDFIRDDNQTSHAVSYTVSGMEFSSEPLTLTITLSGANTAKDYGFADIKVEGRYQGSAPTSPKYSLAVEASPAAGGSVSQNPAGTSIEKDTEIQVSASANAGYFFINWTNQRNEVVSNKNVYTFKLTENTQLKANFKSEADYNYIFANCAPYDAVVDDIWGLKIALSKANGTDRYRIFVRNGEYDFGTTAKTAIKGNVSLIGESQDGVLIFNNPGSVTNYQDQTPVFYIDQNQNNVYMQDLTIRQARDWADKTSKGQALALRQRGKLAIYKNVTLQGVQDTYYLNKADGTAYFETCTLAGEVDFIYGDGTAFFQQCTLHPVSSNAIITAPNTQTGYKGMVFNECTIEKPADAKNAVTGYKLGRPWSDSPAATYINTTMKVLPADAGWGNMTSGLVVRFHEYGSKDANGSLLDLSKRSTAACSPATGSDSPVLTEAQAAEYTLDKVFPSWAPAEQTVQLAAPTAQVSADGVLSWTAVEGALGYAIVCDGQVVGVTSGTSFETPKVGHYSIRVANNMGGLGAPGAVCEVTYTDIESIETCNLKPATNLDLQGRKATSIGKSQLLIHNGRVIFVK